MTYTHANGKNRFVFEILPRKEVAPNRKPRGLVSIGRTIKKRVAPKSFFVFDKWTATVSAVKQLGFRHCPPINHSKYFRDNATGFHSNDIESEFNLIKCFVRERYGRLVMTNEESLDDLEAGELYEHQFYTNVGQTMDKVMKALKHTR